jgi:hypothetical protein
MIGLVVLGAMGACGDGSTGGTTTPSLTVSAEIGSGGEIPSMANAVKANGSNLVSITVVGATKAPITVKTKKGSFEGGVQTTTIDSLSGSVDLTVCDAHNDTVAVSSTNCAGSVTVTATDAGGATGRLTLKFIGYETNCNDGTDNNGDARTDCADPDCDQATCTVGGSAGTCKNNTCTKATCTPASSTEICNNNLDDNCDGKIDCAESTCDGQACKAGSPTFVCQSSVCTDLASGLALTVTPARTRLPADGTTSTTVTAKLLKDGQPLPNTQLSFATNLGGFVGGSGTPPRTINAKTDTDGTATVTFVSDTTQGVVNTGIANITASVNSIVTATGLITIPALGSIKVASIQNQVMGVKYSGWNEQNVIKVALLDTDQKPYPDGLKVRFEHQQLSGSKISSPWTTTPTTCLPANNCLGYETVTSSPSGTADADGIAALNLYSGTAAGLVAVKVSATAGGASRDFTVQDIAIIGAKASGAHFSLECTPRNVPGFWGSQCLFTEYDGAESPIKCTARFADRFNNVLGKATLVTFNSEAGSAGPPTSTIMYDPSNLTDQTKDLGFASDSIAVTGYGLPKDVDPLTGEQFWTELQSKPDRCGYVTHNQRDGLVSIIAMAKGEEGFVDMNGDGVWDMYTDQGVTLPEPFIDQGEPFVDSNDDGIWEPGEYFVDLNGNGSYDGPNGVWDSDTTIWTETRVLYTGAPDTDYCTVTPQVLTVTSSAGGQTATTASASFVFRDINMNSTSPLASPSGNFSAVSELGYTTTKIVYTPSTVDDMGLVFTRQYCADTTDKATCFSVCSSSPCYAFPTISGYTHASANRGLVSITGGSVGTVASPVDDWIDMTIKMDNVTFIGASRIQVHVQ